MPVSAADSYISIVRFSGYNLPDKRRLHVVLIGYCDAYRSGNSVLKTLARIAAPEELWPQFEEEWRTILEENDLLCWHTSDAMSPESKRWFVRLERRDSWTIDDSERVRTELGQLIYRFLVYDLSSCFQVGSCTVNMRDYQIAKENNSYLRPAEAICVDALCGPSNLRLHRADAKIILYFDRNEEFMKTVYPIWEKDRTKRNPDGSFKVSWTGQVEQILGLTATENTFALQAADLIAWEDGHAWQEVSEPMTMPEIIGRKRRIYCDLALIEKEFTVDREKRWRDQNEA